MKKYSIKLFKTRAEYEAFINSTPSKGGVSFVIDGVTYNNVPRSESDDHEYEGEMYYSYYNGYDADFMVKRLYEEVGTFENQTVYEYFDEGNTPEVLSENATIIVTEVTESEYVEPHVSLCKDDNKVNYNLNFPAFEMVDLGLPSGLLWAKCNVGATSEEEYGLYFQWGDTVGYTGDDAKAHSTWATAPFNGGNENFDAASINQAIADGKIDAASGILKPQYDAATVHMGPKYHMPTYGDINELIAQTYHEVAEINGVQGMKYISKSDESKYIFIPFAGYFHEGQFYGEGKRGLIWGSSLSMNYHDVAAPLYCNVYGDITRGASRLLATCVRGVSGASNPIPFIGGGPE